MLLLTMPNLKWTVLMDRWTWMYTFSDDGKVSWKDQYSGMGGDGTWRIVGDKMTLKWVNSTTEEQWDVPLDTNGAKGTCKMHGTDYVLRAVPLNYYYEPGDVVYDVGAKLIRVPGGPAASVIYPDEVRSGGTIAWICRNPGNIKSYYAAKYGAYPDKRLAFGNLGPFAIFPTEETGLAAMVTILKGYGQVSILQAMNSYAGKEDHNKPDAYAATVARDLGVQDSAILGKEVDLSKLAQAMTKVETSKVGTSWARNASDLPQAIRLRLKDSVPASP